MSETQLALPFLIIGLGSEMINFLLHKTEVQNIDSTKSSKLKRDLIKYLYSNDFINEMMTPQPIYNLRACEEIFKKLLSISIFKTKANGWKKLFKIMTMNYKSKLINLKWPEELLDMTVSYMKNLRILVAETDEEVLINDSVAKMKALFDMCSSAGYNRIKQTLFKTLQNSNTKIGSMLKSGTQLRDGSFGFDNFTAPPGTKPPGDGKVYFYGNFRSKLKIKIPLREKYEKSKAPSRRPGEMNINTSQEEEDKSFIFDESERKGVAKWELDSLHKMINPSEEVVNTESVVLDYEEKTAPKPEIKDEKEIVKEMKAKIDNSKLEKMKAYFNEESHKEPSEDDLMINLGVK
ncbi:unnamed protein product [Blepharisma stoltei]|uniref:Uncharacterized protein n=1 Tax=Blepharisma stoltei TaxID=1481888 RepID=A0AAU9IN95_9CILI|nr:unnamed protein product [Blepharisma stoltei]